MPTLALLADDPSTRAELTSYLERAGYRVRAVARPASRIGFLVWIPEDGPDAAAITAALHDWLAPRELRRAVLVTRKPAAFVELLRAYAGRLAVLAAPVFAWQVVDALRAGAVEP